mmetsp:Transcript_5931/g.10899  ORF Transcript_5931/g.10899 Transcript_5931/m.10899 type:complete len:219 (+) Transcript_5931:420-1076(+)
MPSGRNDNLIITGIAAIVVGRLLFVVLVVFIVVIIMTIVVVTAAVAAATGVSVSTGVDVGSDVGSVVSSVLVFLTLLLRSRWLRWLRLLRLLRVLRLGLVMRVQFTGNLTETTSRTSTTIITVVFIAVIGAHSSFVFAALTSFRVALFCGMTSMMAMLRLEPREQAIELWQEEVDLVARTVVSVIFAVADARLVLNVELHEVQSAVAHGVLPERVRAC